MKSKYFLWIFILAVLAIATTGCRKCMCCAHVSEYISCIKGTDTLLVYCKGYNTIMDSTNYYQNHGYTVMQVDTGGSFSGPYR